MKLRSPASCMVSLGGDLLANATGRYQKRLEDLEGLYGDQSAFAWRAREAGPQVVYEVAEYRPSSDEGDMIFGVTRMLPGRIGDEYYMTRGHIHARANRPEIYFGQAGQGVMLMESPDGEIRTETVAPGSICYVPPYWIHRSVNVGEDELFMVFSYPADSGQDYGVIERAGGMGARIVDDGNGGWRSIANASYRPRTPEEIARLYSKAA